MIWIRNVTIDCAQPEKLATFWRMASGYTVAFTSEWFVDLEPPESNQPHICLMRVPEGKVAKNRVHMDLMAKDRAEEVARLVTLGATEGETHTEYEITWTVMQDPEGNEFCVAGEHD